MKLYWLFKFILFFTTFVVILYIVEYGFHFDNFVKFLDPVFLALISAVMLLKPKFRQYGLFFSFFCLTLMMLGSIFNLLEIAKIIGNFGFSLLIITILLYIPQIIKKGSIEKF